MDNQELLHDEIDTAPLSPQPEEEYVFRFKLRPKDQPLPPDQVLEAFYRDQLQDLLKIVFLCRDGEKLLPDQFGFLNKPDVTYAIDGE
jgi:hypothetical protein